MQTIKRFVVALGGVAVLATAAPARAHSIFFALSVPGFAFVAAPPPPPPVYCHDPYPTAFYAAPPIAAATFVRHDHGWHRGGWKRHHRRHHHGDD
jgi:hypothetical protein